MIEFTLTVQFVAHYDHLKQNNALIYGQKCFSDMSLKPVVYENKTFMGIRNVFQRFFPPVICQKTAILGQKKT